jgi:hypothetical protein
MKKKTFKTFTLLITVAVVVAFGALAFAGPKGVADAKADKGFTQKTAIAKASPAISGLAIMHKKADETGGSAGGIAAVAQIEAGDRMHVLANACEQDGDLMKTDKFMEAEAFPIHAAMSMTIETSPYNVSAATLTGQAKAGTDQGGEAFAASKSPAGQTEGIKKTGAWVMNA